MNLQAILHQARLAALARRAATQPEAVQALLQARLQQLGARDATAAVAVTFDLPRAAPPPSPLAVLLAQISDSPDATTATEPGVPARVPRGTAPGPATASAPRSPREGPLELKAVRDYRSTWSRLAVEQRLHQALAHVPPNAGPLNTQRLVHQALRTLHTLSPAYLQRLVVQGEALLWLEPLGDPPPVAPPGERRSPQSPASERRSPQSPANERRSPPARGATASTARRRAG